MSVLYVTHPGAEVRKQGKRLQIRWQREVLRATPLREVERVVLLRPVQLSAGAVQALLKRSIPVVFGTTKGRYCGMLWAGQKQTETLLPACPLVRRLQVYRQAMNGTASAFPAATRNRRSLLCGSLQSPFETAGIFGRS